MISEKDFLAKTKYKLIELRQDIFGSTNIPYTIRTNRIHDKLTEIERYVSNEIYLIEKAEYDNK